MSRIRITGGKWRSRLIAVADVRGLRPTPDRVRQTLFNWLGQDLTGQSCLDLFAGSGVLGFEAASRGAARVALVEQDQGAFAALRQNAQALGGEQLELIRSDALTFMQSAAKFAEADGPGQGRRRRGRYDLVFLDPPYRQGWLARIEPLLQHIANPGARLYVEAEHAIESLGEWASVRAGRAGQVYYHLLERQ
ncbi:MAG TPA: 16S rRNA (guanine(966)-N(2))-methyltransferase RsmD [Rhodocyclaceae bacterium]|nr:16S rRNA (guanine(966)-N(2))-methyltransferase RsmD [Rhodocyclaceae bacterium]